VSTSPLFRRPRDDDGFTLVEILVSITVMGILMTALTSFFTTSLAVTKQQSGKQMAAQIADGAVEKVRAMRGSSVVTGRDRNSSDTQWNNPATGVSPYLADMREAWDSTAVFPAGATAPLPTQAVPVVVNGVSYSQYWYVGRCWQPAAGGDCGSTQTTGFVEFYRVVVAVTWPNVRCGATGICAYVTSTLVGNSEDPIFNPNQTVQPPAVSNPGAQVSTVTVAVSLQLTSSGGAPPVTWSGTGLPPGITVASNGLTTGTPTTAGTYNVVASATDAFGQTGTAAFTWTVNAVPVLTNPGDQASAIGDVVSLQPAMTGGSAPLTWSVTKPTAWGATGLPPGLSLNTTTGRISGTATTAGPARDVTLTVTDHFGVASSVTFKWRVQSLRAVSPGAQSTAAGNLGFVLLSATGGTGVYTWTFTNVPSGMSTTTSGLIWGFPDHGTQWLVTATVTDSAGATDSVTFDWTVTSNPSYVQVTSPSADRTDNLNANISFTAAASGGGGGGGYTWTATGLPTGVTITSGGVVSGRVTQTGTYTTTLTATSNNGKWAKYMFTWTVQ
jgi:prepilin-type N-terminal cleavage/methylation domain-containing protein